VAGRRRRRRGGPGVALRAGGAQARRVTPNVASGPHMSCAQGGSVSAAMR
jgi:hypothetical protein